MFSETEGFLNIIKNVQAIMFLFHSASQFRTHRLRSKYVHPRQNAVRHFDFVAFLIMYFIKLKNIDLQVTCFFKWNASGLNAGLNKFRSCYLKSDVNVSQELRKWFHAVA